MHRFKNGIRRMFGLLGRAWRRRVSSEDGAKGGKFSGIALLVVAVLVLFIGWRTVTTIQRLSSPELLLSGNDGPEFSSVDATSSGASSVSGAASDNADRGEPVVTVVPPPAPEVPEVARPFHFRDFVQPVRADDYIGPGWRRNAETAFWYYESAFVLQAPVGSPVVAAGPGIVTAMVPASGSAGGWNVTIEHDEHFTTVYDNVFDVEVAPGNAVSAHTRLGSVMSRSLRDGLPSDPASPSIAFAVVHDGEAIDAMALLPDL